MRAKIQDSLGQKDAIQDQVKLMGVDLDGSKIDSLREELTAVTQKRDKAYETIKELRKQRDEGNAHFYQSRSLLNKAKELAAKKDVKAIEELSTAEVEKFMALWSGKKTFRYDYKKRILPSLDSRQLSRDGRIRNPDEKPLVVPEAPVPSETEMIPKPSVRQPKEEAKSSPQPDTKLPKNVQKDAETKVMESKSSLENGVVAEKEISGSGKLQKDTNADKEVDAAKLKEIKREEEIAKAKQAMEKKKKLAEKAAAKAAIRAQKEAEKKLKEIISFFILFCFLIISLQVEIDSFDFFFFRSVKRKQRRRRQHPQLLQILRIQLKLWQRLQNQRRLMMLILMHLFPLLFSVKDKVQKENTIRYRNRTKGSESLPRAILKSTNYWIWAAPAALVVLILLALGY
ncbi:hypothetical protein CRYUN_Cryun39dG0038300 [Craigia yunnanensis]